MADYAVIGLGKFGYFVAKFLADLGQNVVAVDSDDEKVRDVKSFVSKSVTADAKMPGVLQKLDVRKMHAVLVCFDESLGESVIITHILSELSVRNIICVVANEEHEEVLQKMGATEIIFPHRQAAFSLVQSLSDSYREE